MVLPICAIARTTSTAKPLPYNAAVWPKKRTFAREACRPCGESVMRQSHRCVPFTATSQFQGALSARSCWESRGWPFCANPSFQEQALDPLAKTADVKVVLDLSPGPPHCEPGYGLPGPPVLQSGGPAFCHRVKAWSPPDAPPCSSTPIRFPGRNPSRRGSSTARQAERAGGNRRRNRERESALSRWTWRAGTASAKALGSESSVGTHTHTQTRAWALQRAAPRTPRAHPAGPLKAMRGSLSLLPPPWLARDAGRARRRSSGRMGKRSECLGRRTEHRELPERGKRGSPGNEVPTG